MNSELLNSSKSDDSSSSIPSEPFYKEIPAKKFLSQLPPKPTSCGKKAKIVLDSSCSLPTKRESIRMLYENKAVTENPLKSTLETHFYNMNTAKRIKQSQQ